MITRKDINALSEEELSEISDIIYDRRKFLARAKAQPLSQFEVNLVAEGKNIEAIKVYRMRLLTTLMEAKVAVDIHRNLL